MSANKAPTKKPQPSAVAEAPKLPASHNLPQSIVLRGVRTHNLKNVSCQIPHRALTVITGPSGSGKSSLAFDTLYAEGQRRYLESMSTYARQFLDRIEKPAVDHIEHILPAIALEQKNAIKNARSTVGTATEIYDYLQILFATMGQTVCPDCQKPVTENHPQQIVDTLQQLPDKTKLLILAPVRLSVTLSLTDLQQAGYHRVLLETGEIHELDTVSPNTPMLRVVIDRLAVSKTQSFTHRCREAVQNALALTQGQIEVYQVESGKSHSYQGAFACGQCQRVFNKPTPAMFSFNSPLGACLTCEGYGRVMGLDLEKVIPNPNLTLAQGAVHPFSTPANHELQDALLNAAPKHGVRIDVSYAELTETEKAFVLNGSPQKADDYPGIQGFFDWLETKRYKVHVRVMLSRYRSYSPCPDCHGARINPQALWVNVNGLNILEVCQLPVETLLPFLQHLNFSSDSQQKACARVYAELLQRVDYLYNVGLGYLTLERQSRTLSGGEAQRINLSTALGSSLTETLYVLDEPTVGLHARDTQRLLGVMQNLRDNGNTLVVVEHDPEMIRGADYIIDMGPASGENGGQIVYEGALTGLIKQTETSVTARYLYDSLKPENFRPENPRKKSTQNTPKQTKPKQNKSSNGGKPIQIIGATGNNLQNLTVSIPSEQLVCVTGVSGSGKSSLIKQTLFAGAERQKGIIPSIDPLPCQALKGLEQFADVILVDQSPPGRSLRSNPVTYVKAYDDIRQLFASSRKAKVLGLSASDFSFNTPGGRCETCEGLGTQTIDMQFMADVTVTCPACQGKRFQAHVLSVDLYDRNILDVLNMTVQDALSFFKTASKIHQKLKPLQDLGLGYLRLGQSTATLSGGEAQRLKLASYLRAEASQSSASAPILFLFDEPTTGLHLSDIDVLLSVFRQLVAAGHSLVVIEHNLDLVRQADWIIDLGPEGGSGGGKLLAEGQPEAIIACKASHTGRFLGQLL